MLPAGTGYSDPNKLRSQQAYPRGAGIGGLCPSRRHDAPSLPLRQSRRRGHPVVYATG
ncbi:hypothetical protein M427DRAFT_152943, partial [Gonapodya prolifera JEL478]